MLSPTPPVENTPRVLVVIQARMGSTRLPSKVLLDLAGRPVLAHVIERMRRSRLTSDFIVATTINRDDLAIVGLYAEMGVRVYCGHEQDPLERYYRAARLFGADHVVRIKGDCPAIDPQILDEAIRPDGHDGGLVFAAELRPAAVFDRERHCRWTKHLRCCVAQIPDADAQGLHRFD